MSQVGAHGQAGPCKAAAFLRIYPLEHLSGHGGAVIGKIETDAHRSRSLQHQLSQQSLRRDSACVPPYAAMIPTLAKSLIQRHAQGEQELDEAESDTSTERQWMGLVLL